MICNKCKPNKNIIQKILEKEYLITKRKDVCRCENCNYEIKLKAPNEKYPETPVLVMTLIFIISSLILYKLVTTNLLLGIPMGEKPESEQNLVYIMLSLLTTLSFFLIIRDSIKSSKTKVVTEFPKGWKTDIEITDEKNMVCPYCKIKIDPRGLVSTFHCGNCDNISIKKKNYNIFGQKVIDLLKFAELIILWLGMSIIFIIFELSNKKLDDLSAIYICGAILISLAIPIKYLLKDLFEKVKELSRCSAINHYENNI